MKRLKLIEALDNMLKRHSVNVFMIHVTLKPSGGGVAYMELKTTFE